LFGEDAPLRQQIYAQRPELATKYVEFGTVLREERLLPDRLVELVRLRIAFWNQCRSCMALRYEDAIADGLTEDLVCSLERPQEADDLTEAERVAIAYGDLMATNHLAVDDETFERLREHFSEPEIVELCLNVAWFVGFGRMAATLNFVEDLPERFRREGERITPWGDGELVVRA
jgi:AhpD family alkylhydroperoxidase